MTTPRTQAALQHQTSGIARRPYPRTRARQNQHRNPHQRQVVTLVQFTFTRSIEFRTDIPRPDTGNNIQTSRRPGRGALLDHDNSRRCVTHDERPRGGVRQDKGVLTNAAPASLQPAPDTKSIRVQFTNNGVVRSQNHSAGKQKPGRLTLWGINPAVYSELERIADEESLSLSQVGKTALGEWIHQRLHDRHESLLYPVLRQLIRDELKAFGNRIIFFLMRIAFAAEQSRILITNVLHKICMQMGLPSDKFDALLDSSNKMARRNIITHAPEMKKLMEEWEAYEKHGDKQDATGKEKK